MKPWVLKFLLRFFLVFGIASTALYYLDFSFFNNWIAQLVGTWIGLEVQGNLFLIHGQSVVVANYCNGLSSASILAGIVFGFTRPELRKKLKIFLVGLLVLQVMNLLRVYFVLQIGVLYGIDHLVLAHSVSWGGMSLIILGYWYWAVGKKTLDSFD
jgi:exosortase/archaeosortase family protein